MQPLLMQQHNAGQQCGVQGHQAGGSYTVYSYPFYTTCQRTPTAEIADFHVGMCEGSSILEELSPHPFCSSGYGYPAWWAASVSVDLSQSPSFR